MKGGEEELDQALTFEIERLKRKKGVQSKTNEHFTGIFYFDDTINDREFPLLHKLLYSYVRKIFPHYQEQLILNT